MLSSLFMGFLDPSVGVYAVALSMDFELDTGGGTKQAVGGRLRECTRE